jgi:hypothetical protein
MEALELFSKSWKSCEENLIGAKFAQSLTLLEGIISPPHDALII